MSPLDAIPHVLIVYKTPPEEGPDYRWEPVGIQSATEFPTRPEAEVVGKQVSAYTGCEWEVVKLDQPVSVT